MDITSSTKIQLWGVLAAVPFLIGGIMWLTTIYSTAVEAQRANEKQDQKIESQMNLLLDIRERVIRIETKLPKN